MGASVNPLFLSSKKDRIEVSKYVVEAKNIITENFL
jgi:hypothetical protein